MTVQISTSGTSATASFSGTAGQRVSLYVSSSTISYSKVSLLKPDGTAVFSVSVQESAKFVDTHTLPVNGTYRLVINPSSTYTGRMTLRLYNVPADATGTLATDGLTPTTVTTTTPGQNAFLTFSGLTGQRIALRLSGVTVSLGKLSVLNPDASKLFGAQAFSKTETFIDPLTLPQNGTYKVILDPTLTASGSITVTAYDVPPDASAPVSANGTPVTGTVTVPGQRARFTFNVAALPQRVSLNVTSADFSGQVFLIKPDASVLATLAVSASGAFLEPQSLPVTGAYSVLVDPSGSQTGALTFSLYTVPSDTTGSISAGGAAVTVTNSVPGQNNYLTFAGTLNQRISVLVGNVSDDPAKLSILKPDGTRLFSPATVSSAGAYVDVKVLPVAGTYKLLLDPSGAAIGSADVRLFTVPSDLNGTIAPGTPLPVTTSAPGQNASYTFSGALNQRVSLDLSNVTMTRVKVAIVKPDGSQLASQTVGTSGGFFDTVSLPATGTYRVLVDPQAASYGDLTLRLYTVPADSTGTLSAGVNATVTTAVPGQNATRTFSGTANQRISFNLTSVTMTTVRVTVKRPDGSTFFSTLVGGEGAFVEPNTLSVSGTYKILIDPQGNSTGSITIAYYVVPADVNASASIGSSVPISIGAPGQNGKITFAGTAGANVTFTPSNVTFPPAACCTLSVELMVYFGATKVGGSEFAGPSASFSFARTLPSTGTYTIVVDPFGAATGGLTMALS